MEPNITTNVEQNQQYTYKQFKSLLFKRIGMEELETITFDNLPSIMESFANAVPFENLDMVSRTFKPITRDNNITKVLVNGEGGLCYNLNTLFFQFLKESGLDVIHCVATVKDPYTDIWAVPNGHMITVLTHQSKEYLVDVGFGLFLAFKPILLNEETGVTSRCGSYRFLEMASDYGTHVLEIKKKNKETGELYWDTGYAFKKEHAGVIASQQAQINILEDKGLLFNTYYLVCKLQKEGGQATLSGKDKVLVVTNENGDKQRTENIEINSDLFNSLLIQYMGFPSKEQK
ncbi:arylamine N-acetyltransferase family protein [Cavenderia fasciculata]|uniref:Arylamine N-acetyltransferase family protein n=1 Tax=Cavenderia fasciculata TaxID=261658 RepID=F4Q3K0_CACFS|nr:arylamine N-acetyltransferase family protein [Cavenderia fasciculata]EGG17658.1 arylamine N-acetyltransferase family protein [Cavenderia fasciculata]|eukprot:XP_004356142.1 arylamine N-acetyltransferase family protein [Cavenderia fasciculata]